ncbi:MAG: hypothetical protein ACKOQM_10145 [Novosphingobium sp.]
MLPIAQIVEQHEALSGKRVRSKGWLQTCYNLGCILYEKPGKLGQSINIGSSRSFDRKVAAYRGRELLVEVEGVIDPTCFDHSKDAGNEGEMITVCMDRASELKNPKLLRVLQIGPTPTNESN